MAIQRRKLPRSLFEEVMENLIPLFGEPLVKRFPNLTYYLLLSIYTLLTVILWLVVKFDSYLLIFLIPTFLGIIFWSHYFNFVVKSIREAKYPLFDPRGVEIHCSFYEFLIKGHSLVLTTVFCFLGISYFISSELMSKTMELFNVTINDNMIVKVFFFFYLFLLTFDISFRVITSFNGVLSIFYRNFLFERFVLNNNKETKSKLPYIVISSSSDKSIFYLFIFFFFWLSLPLLLADFILISLFIGTFVFIFFSVLINSAWVRKLKMKTIPLKAQNPLLEEYRAFLATTSKTFPHVTPVLHAFDGLNLYFNTSLSSKKIKNLRFSPNAAILVKSSKYASKIIMQGKARSYGYNFITGIIIPLIHAPELIYAFFLLRKKYSEELKFYQKQKLPLKWSVKPFIARTLIKFTPENIKVTNL